MKSLLYTSISVTHCVTYYRVALIVTYTNIKNLMCYFHMMNCCKKNLRNHPSATQKQICKYVYYLHSSISQIMSPGIGRLPESRGQISQSLQGTSQPNGFWVTLLIGKFTAVNQALQAQTTTV
jgi:hypothetical protein